MKGVTFLKDLRQLNKYRNNELQTEMLKGCSLPRSKFGSFRIPLNGNDTALVIADNAMSNPDWEHVSVSLPDRCLTWDEMCKIKDLFFDDEEAVFQIHPPKSEYVNFHEYCLHLWKPKGVPFPRPHWSSVF